MKRNNLTVRKTKSYFENIIPKGKKSIIKTAMTAMALSCTFSAFTPTKAMAATYPDTSGIPEESAIEKFTEKGYLTGFDDGTFRPDANIRRNEIATMLSQMGFELDLGEMSFMDVNEGDWFYDHVLQATKNGFIVGYPEGTFLPDNNITRFEAIKIVGYLVDNENWNNQNLPFSDKNEIPLWVYNDVSKLHGNGILPNYTAINGQEKISRKEVALMMCNAFEKAGWDTTAMEEILKEVKSNPLPQATAIPGELLGYITIPSINLNKNPVRDGHDLETLKKSIGHFTTSAIWDGNVSMLAHNRDYTYDFRNLNKVKQGDTVIYESRFGKREYTVTSITNIAETDWKLIEEDTPKNCLTLVTCIEDKPSLRLLVRCEQI